MKIVKKFKELLNNLFSWNSFWIK